MKTNPNERIPDTIETILETFRSTASDISGLNFLT